MCHEYKRAEYILIYSKKQATNNQFYFSLYNTEYTTSQIYILSRIYSISLHSLRPINNILNMWNIHEKTGCCDMWFFFPFCVYLGHLASVLYTLFSGMLSLLFSIYFNISVSVCHHPKTDTVFYFFHFF